MKIKKIIDISRNLYPQMMVWPGDKKLKINRGMSTKTGDTVNVSSLELSAHTGTHIDAPFHFFDDGLDIISLDLTKFLSFVKVFELKVERCITDIDLLSLDIEEGDAIILKTSNSFLPEDEPLSEKYTYLDISAAEYLVTKKVKTIGVDHLTVDSLDSKDFPVHKLLLSNKIGIIEGLRLKAVNEGIYLLAALPLKLEGLDGSPIRAVLAKLEL
jgi:arylformamidase